MVNPDRILHEPPYDDALMYDTDYEPERPRGRPLVVLLGVVVVAAFASVVWVAYNQGVKQGQRGGTPPVLNADVGPTRVEPVDVASAPTTNPAPEKSYDRLWNSDGTGVTTGEEVILPNAEQPRGAPSAQELASNMATAPQADVDDAAGGPQGAPPPIDPRFDATIDPPSTDSVNTVRAPSAAPVSAVKLKSDQAGPREDITAAVPRVSTGAQDGGVGANAASPTARSPSKPPAALIVAPKVKTVPPEQNDGFASSATSPSELSSGVAAVPPAVETPAPASKASIQLGAFPSDALAASAWSRIKGAHQNLLGNYSPAFMPVPIEGKGTWYRLRVGGFSSKSDASDVCAQLKASNQDCMVVAK